MTTQQQRQAALHKANRHRTARAQAKLALKRRDLAPSDLLTEVPEWAATMTVADVLRAIPKIGKVKANSLCMRLAIRPSQAIGRLTKRQRLIVLAALEPNPRQRRDSMRTGESGTLLAA